MNVVWILTTDNRLNAKIIGAYKTREAARTAKNYLRTKARIERFPLITA